MGLVSVAWLRFCGCGSFMFVVGVSEVFRSGLGWVALGVGLVWWAGCVGCGSGVWVWDAVADFSLDEDSTGLLGGWWIDRFDVASDEDLGLLCLGLLSFWRCE